MRQVFLSFCHDHDAAAAGRLAGSLAAVGVVATYDTRQMSHDWWESFTRPRLDASDAVVVLMTPEAQRSPWVAREIERARQLDKPVFIMGYQELSAEGGPDLSFLSPPRTDRVVPLQRGVTAAAVGIETAGGTFTRIIDHGRPAPVERTEVFTTADDGQRSINIKVFQGNSPTVAGCTPLGSYELLLERRAPAGVPQVHVTFRIEASGTFRLLAKDGNGHEVQVTTRTTS